jgi:hypothetical protein
MTTQPNQPTTQKEGPAEPTTSSTNATDPKELGLYATGGALAGIGISHIGGGIALAAASTAALVGMLPAIAAGSAVGIAAYGAKKGLFKIPQFFDSKKSG